MQVRPISAVATLMVEKTPENWARLVKDATFCYQVDLEGNYKYWPEWTFEDRAQPAGQWALVMRFEGDYDNLKKAPNKNA